MEVSLTQIKSGALGLAALLLGSAAACAQDQAGAQALPSAPMPSPNVLQVPGQIEKATPGVLSLSLDDAIARGVEHNLNVRLSRANEMTVHGTILSVGNALLPNMQVALGQHGCAADD